MVLYTCETAFGRKRVRKLPMYNLPQLPEFLSAMTRTTPLGKIVSGSRHGVT